MAVLFRAEPNLDRIDIPFSASLGSNPTAFTWWGWVYPTTDLQPNFVATRINSGVTAQGAYVRLVSGINFFVSRAGGGAELQTNAAQYTLNAWNFFAFTYNAGGAAAADTINAYTGTLSSTVTETAYTAQLQGSGATQDSDGAFILGNRITYNKPLDGEVAYWGIVNRYLSLGEIRSLQWNPRVVSNTAVFISPGYAGATTIPDWSGNTNTGTGNGLSVTDHVPISPTWKGNPSYFGEPGISGHPSNADHVPLSPPYATSNPEFLPLGQTSTGAIFIRGSRLI